MLLRLKIHVFCLIIHPDKQTNVNHLAFSRHAINIRYLFVFQIEKIFCPKFLLKARTADKREYELCLLVKLGFAPSQINMLTGRSLQDIANIRKRMYNRITGKDGSSRDFDRYIKSL